MKCGAGFGAAMPVASSSASSLRSTEPYRCRSVRSARPITTRAAASKPTPLSTAASPADSSPRADGTEDRLPAPMRETAASTIRAAFLATVAPSIPPLPPTSPKQWHSGCLPWTRFATIAAVKTSRRVSDPAAPTVANGSGSTSRTAQAISTTGSAPATNPTSTVGTPKSATPRRVPDRSRSFATAEKTKTPASTSRTTATKTVMGAIVPLGRGVRCGCVGFAAPSRRTATGPSVRPETA